MEGDEQLSIEELASNLSTYTDQLHQVRQLLADDPGNSEYVDMEKELTEEDLSQVFALATIWILIFALGSSVCLVPVLYTANLTHQDPFSSEFSYIDQASTLEFLSRVNGIFFTLFGAVIGYPIASAAVRVLRRLWKNDLVGLKGACPNCAEEVFAFVRSDQPQDSRHRADCHVCESSLEFRTIAEENEGLQLLKTTRSGSAFFGGRIRSLEINLRSIASSSDF